MYNGCSESHKIKFCHHIHRKWCYRRGVTITVWQEATDSLATKGNNEETTGRKKRTTY